MTKKSYSIAVSAAIASLIAFAPQAVAAKDTSVTVAQEARETLQNMRELAVTVVGEAEEVETYNQSPRLGSTTYVVPLQALRQSVNAMGQEIVVLDARRESLEPWERQVVDKVLPLLKDAAANTESAIEHFNENPGRLWTPEYRGYADKIYRDSDQIAKLLKDSLKYEKVREEEQKLQTTIDAEGN